MPANTEGMSFSTAEMRRTLEDRKRRHKRQAVIGVCVGSLLLAMPAAVFAALCFIPELPLWTVLLFAALAVLCILPIGFTLVVLRQRFKEIEGGELDAAAEY